jgi:hypothetical protein
MTQKDTLGRVSNFMSFYREQLAKTDNEGNIHAIKMSKRDKSSKFKMNYSTFPLN